MTCTVTIPDADVEAFAKCLGWDSKSAKKAEDYAKDKIASFVKECIRSYKINDALETTRAAEKAKADSAVTAS